MLGADDPGKVTWAPQVLEAARGYDLVLLQDGRLIDTTVGQTVPPDATEARPLTSTELNLYKKVSVEEMSRYIVRLDDIKNKAGITDENVFPELTDCIYPLAGPYYTKDGAFQGGEDWYFNFNLVAAKTTSGQTMPHYSRQAPEVYNPFNGKWRFSWTDEHGENSLVLEADDTFTCPAGVYRSFENIGTEESIMYVVLGGDVPSPAVLASVQPVLLPLS